MVTHHPSCAQLGVVGLACTSGEADGGSGCDGGADWEESKGKKKKLSGGSWLEWMAKESGEDIAGGFEGRLADAWDYSAPMLHDSAAAGRQRQDGGMSSRDSGGGKGNGHKGKGRKGGKGGKGGKGMGKGGRGKGEGKGRHGMISKSKKGPGGGKKKR